MCRQTVHVHRSTSGEGTSQSGSIVCGSIGVLVAVDNDDEEESAIFGKVRKVGTNCAFSLEEKEILLVTRANKLTVGRVVDRPDN
jgi:hypothetical protein